MMKKTTFFKIVLSVALALMVSGAYGQYGVTAPTTDYDDYTSVDGTAKQTIEGTEDNSYITVGKTLPIVVMPDPAFLSADYDFNTEAADGLTSSWAWNAYTDAALSAADGDATVSLGSGIADADRPDDSGLPSYNYKDGGIGPLGDNFATVSFSTAGIRYLEVIESSDAAYGGCAGDATTMAIVAFPVPEIYFNGTDDDNYELTDNLCGVQTTDIILNLEGAPHTDGDGFNFNWTMYVETVQSDGNTQISEVSNVTLDQSNVSGGPVAMDIDGDSTDESFTWAEATARVLGTGTNGEYTLTNNYTFTVENNQITKYTLTMNWVNDDISRKSDYWAGSTEQHTNFAGGEQELVFYVKPEPTTGNIYHIPN